MNTKDNRQNVHNEIDHIFRSLLPAQGMAERPAQIVLSHQMLDAMLDGGIALCDAGTGIGKTYAYLVAGTAFHRFRAAQGLTPLPLLISTSSIALQDAVVNSYLPFLSKLLLVDGILRTPLRAIIRKGKSHYVCDERLRQRLQVVNLKRKNPKAREALLSLRDHLDLDLAIHLSGYDRERVCVPRYATVAGVTAGISALWTCVIPEGINFKSATTTCFWQMPFTAARGSGPSSRNTAGSSLTRPTSCRKPPSKCLASRSWRKNCGP